MVERVATHLFIPDTHADPNDNSLDRFDLIGNFILAKRPDKIIIIGDWFSLDSLSNFIKYGSVSASKLRLKDDVEIGLEAYNRAVAAPLLARQAIDRQNKQKLYNPTVHFVFGNHEYRINRFIEENPIFQGMLDLEEYIQELYPCTVTNYTEYIDVDGVLYTHVPINRNGKPLSGYVNICGRALDLVDQSVCFGHTHGLEIKQKIRAGSYKLITAFNGGCWLDQMPDYVSNPNWWSGLTMLNVYDDGRFDFTTYSMDYIKGKYV